MKSTGIRELKNNLSRYLRRLRPGEVLTVTDRGRIVAELRALDERADDSPLARRYARLVATGIVRRARETGNPLADWPGRSVRLPPGTAATLVDEDRGG